MAIIDLTGCYYCSTTAAAAVAIAAAIAAAAAAAIAAAARMFCSKELTGSRRTCSSLASANWLITTDDFLGPDLLAGFVRRELLRRKLLYICSLLQDRSQKSGQPCLTDPFTISEP